MTRNVADQSGFEAHARVTLDAAKTTEAFTQQILTLIGDLGFSDFDYSQVANMNNIGLTFGSLPQAMLETYIDASLHRHDMVLEYVTTNLIPIYQSTLYQYIAQSPFGLERHQQNLVIRQLLDGYGFYDAYIIPVQLKKIKQKICFSILSRNLDSTDFQQKVEQSRTQLHQLSHCIQAAAIKKFPDFFVKSQDNHSTLTRRQIQVLDTLAKHAKTSQQAADRLHISVRTVNKHIEEAKESLGAFSTSNAIYLAIEKKLIPIDT